MNEKKDYIDMSRNLNFEPTDTWNSKLYAFGCVKLTFKYYLVWVKNYLDALATELEVHPEFASYFKKCVNLDSQQLRDAVETIESLLGWMYRAF